jgi:N-hydroxyarylamine O-acetyltransferase
MGSVVGMIRAVENLAPPTRDAVLDRLGFSGTPTVDRPGLDAVYLAWCRTVPFDNVIKRIDIVGGTAPFRNDLPEDFFALFLAHGTGGTCWPSTRALAALLRSIGFDVRLGSASMADDVAGRVHTHGTILATLDDELLWVDTSMLTDVPVPLVRGAATALAHPFRPVRVEPVDDLWRVHWMQSARPASMGCLLLDDDVDGDHYSARYEWSRGWSPFNTSLFATTNRDDHVVSLAGAHRFVRDTDGVRDEGLLDGDARRQALVEEFGYSEEIADLLPADEPPSR